MRISLDQYLQLRNHMLDTPEWAPQYEWSETVGRPLDAEEFAAEMIFVVVNSGMAHRVARKIFDRVIGALRADQPITDSVFGHRKKVEAIVSIWTRRQALFDELAEIPDERLVEWCDALPHIGPITAWHAAKNMGLQIAKPDRWLVRLAEASQEDVQGMCARLGLASGDRPSTVDLVLWWALANAVLVIAEGGGLQLPRARTAAPTPDSRSVPAAP